jgi:hypothetical protein
MKHDSRAARCKCEILIKTRYFVDYGVHTQQNEIAYRWITSILRHKLYRVSWNLKYEEENQKIILHFRT